MLASTRHLINPCNHEEANTRIFVHVKDAQQGQGMNRAIIHTVDTDVVVLGVAAVVRLKDLQLTIAFGSRQYFRYINVNKIAVLLGEEKALALPMFHAFTGCDTVSFFAGKGKRSAMKTWEITPTVTQSFLSVEQNPSVVADEDMAIIEQFVVNLYHPTSESSSVNAVRLELFAKNPSHCKHSANACLTASPRSFSCLASLLLGTNVCPYSAIL